MENCVKGYSEMNGGLKVWASLQKGIGVWASQTLAISNQSYHNAKCVTIV
jgi:hypothetical protein